jgi:hypothetical protein
MKYINTILVCLILFGCTKEKIEQDLPEQDGKVAFWVASDLQCGTIAVVINGRTELITSAQITKPNCGASGTATFTLSPGTYTYSASCSGVSWNGEVSVTSGECITQQLTRSSSPVPGPGNAPTITNPFSIFLANQGASLNSLGNYTESFTLTKSTKLVFRFTSEFQMQASLITPSQLASFKNNSTFSGFGTFDKTIGTRYLTLEPGTYYLAIRNTTRERNEFSFELDYDISLPASDKVVFEDIYLNETQLLKAGTRLWQPFTIQNGFRYFLDGCNVNCEVNIIPTDQLSRFQNGSTYQYYSDYNMSGSGGAPGGYEIKLPPGTYYIVSSNSTAGALTFTMERWRKL